MRMDLQMDSKDHILIAFLNGELDQHVAERVRIPLESRMESGRHKHVVLNMEKVSFMDSSGIGVILGRYNWLKKRDGKMVICGVRPVIRKVMELSGMLKIIPVVDRLDEALQMMGGRR